ncbi:MAG TPA: hypothetical protein VMB81_01240 [Candidatus Sulfotelmatobacter sp.]|nr:hypothetical protein [Candidatus Sulfotelmatobacter sp.]
MVRYRCYLLDAHDRIRHVEAIDCCDDDRARARAAELLSRHPTLHSMALWDRERLVPSAKSPEAEGS